MYMARVPYLRSLKAPLRLRILLVMASASAILVSCIDRSNPFDPINNAPQAAVDLRKRDKPALDSLAAGESAFASFLMGVLAKFAAESAANEAIAKNNAQRRIGNQAVETGNAQVQLSNSTQAIKDSLRLKAKFVELENFKAYGPYAGFLENRAGLHAQAVSVTTHLTLVNAGNFPLLVYSPLFFDSVLAPFARDSVGYALAKIRFDSANIAVADSNRSVDAYNDGRAAINLLVQRYNDSISFLKRIQNVNVITRSDSLQSGVFAAKAGDSLFLGPGTFNVDLRFTNTGTADSPIVVSGFPGRATIIRPSLSGTGSKNSMVLGPGKQFIRFENLVFRGGVQGNVKLEGGAGNIAFRNCLFDSSAGPGLEVFDSHFTMTDCEITANADVGVKLGGGVSTGGALEFTNVLIARNGKSGLHSTSQRIDISRCTLAENGEDGIRIISPLQKVRISNTLIASNHGYGIEREATSTNQDMLDVSETDVFGNDSGNWFLPKMDSSVTSGIFSLNLSEDPAFTNAPAFDYTPRPGSLLDSLERRSPPMVIGYRKPAP